MNKYANHAGYVAHRKGPAGPIVIYRAVDQGIDVDGRYAIVCEAHGTIVGVATRRDAIRSARAASFCEECEALLGSKVHR